VLASPDRLLQARSRMRTAVTHLIRREDERLAAIRSRPVLARPHTMLEAREREVTHLQQAGTRTLTTALAAGRAEISRLAAQVRALSPAATLDRGYAVVQRADDGAVVRSPADVGLGTGLRLRVARGEIAAQVVDPAGAAVDQVRSG
jgi:exodeoxyribonuclease VII large subunit